jgi:ABC-2 type transport system permease protein
MRLFGRNRQVLFWTLFFPIFFMVLLGSFLGNGNSVSLHGVVIDLDRTSASQALSVALGQSPIVQLQPAGELNPSLEALKHGDQQMVVFIPQGYGQSMEVGKASGPTGLKVYYDETNAATSQIRLVAMG